MPADARDIGLLLCATASYAVSGAIASGIGVRPLAMLALTSAGQAAGVGAWMALSGRRIGWPAPRLLALVTLLDTAQVGMYLVALRIGPVGPVAALHLTVPVWYLGWAVLRRRRRFGRREAASLSLMLAGAALAAGSAAGGAPARTALALGLAVVSAVLLSLLLRVVASFGDGADAPSVLALRALGMSALALPALLLAPPSPSDAFLLLGVGAVALTVAGLLQWRSVARLAPTVYGTLGLAEAILTAVFAFLLFGAPLVPAHALAAAAILGAAWIEIRSARGGPARRTPGRRRVVPRPAIGLPAGDAGRTPPGGPAVAQ